jgi:ABC-type spermidine/putrescine transport system permease subunit II
LKQTTAANLAMMLVAVAWPLAIYGALSQLGDPSPSVSNAQLNAARHSSLAILLTGVLSLIAASWLSGYAFHGARRRAALTLAAVVMPAVVIYWNMR